MEEVRIDVRTQSPERIAEAKRSSDLCFRINQTNPTTPECSELVQELFNNTLGENTVIHPPIFTILADKVKIGKNVTILNGFQCMSAGGLTIEDNTITDITDGFAVYLYCCNNCKIKNNSIDGSRVYQVDCHGNIIMYNK